MKMKPLCLTLLMTTSPLFAQSKPTVSVKKMDVSEVFQQTLDSVQDCIEYCVDGISLYAIITPWGISYYWTPNISHNSPDLLMMSYNDLRDSPWQEFDDFFGEAYAAFTESILQAATGVDVEIGGGRERHRQWGIHQSVAFKEAAGLGHPAAVILKMFDQGGLKPKGKWVKNGKETEFVPCKTNGCLEEENSALGNSLRQENDRGGTGEQSADSWLSDFYGGQSMNTTPSMVEGFGGNMANMDSVADNDQLSGFMQNIGQGVSSFGSTGQRLFCPINITPFMPYYLSGLDGVEWRMGYPISDLRYSKQILNPFSSDGIGTSVKDQLSLGELQFSLPAISETWGNLYPHEGVLNHPWDSKRGTVIVARAADIMVEDKQSTRIRYQPDDSNNGFGGWGKIFPVNGDTTPGQTAAACHKKVANTGITINETGGYAWTFWRRYNCDMRTTGVYITTIKFPQPICLTPEVPD